MLTPDLFEQLLATYPAEKRELARQVYYRFAEGDSTQFFTQLFILLDVYAQYAERVPQAVIEANQNAHINFAKLREEIGLLAQAIDKRNLNITNHAARTDELCREAVAKCDDTIARFEAVLKNIGTQVDTKAIVAGIQTTVETSINRDIISPFVSRSEELAKEVTPTLTQIRDAAAEASRFWPERIWKTAWTTSLFWSIGSAVILTSLFCVKFMAYCEHKMAAQVTDMARVMKSNQEAFRQLAIAGVPVKVYRSEDSGGRVPGGFALVIEDADSAELRPVDGHKCGFIFFTSPRQEKQIQQLKQETERLSDPAKPK